MNIEISNHAAALAQEDNHIVSGDGEIQPGNGRILASESIEIEEVFPPFALMFAGFRRGFAVSGKLDEDDVLGLSTILSADDAAWVSISDELRTANNIAAFAARPGRRRSPTNIWLTVR